MVLTIIVTYVIYIVFESPFIRILEIIKNKERPIQVTEVRKQEDGNCCDGQPNHQCKNSHYMFSYWIELGFVYLLGHKIISILLNYYYEFFINPIWQFLIIRFIIYYIVFGNE